MAPNDPAIPSGRIGCGPLDRGECPPELQRICQDLDEVLGVFTGAVFDLLAA